MINSPKKAAEDIEAGTVVEIKKPMKEKKKDKNHHRQFPGFRKNLHHYFAEYSSNTGIHGFKYMGDHERTIFERLWWLVIFCISLYICINLIMQTYNKWKMSPVLVSFAKSPTPVWQIPFPAVTICSETKARQSVYNYTKNYNKMLENSENMTAKERQELNGLALVCDDSLSFDDNLTTGFDTIDFLVKVAPQIDEMVWISRYKKQVLNNIKTFFTPVLTEEGLCFTSNMLARTELFRNKV